MVSDEQKHRRHPARKLLVVMTQFFQLRKPSAASFSSSRQFPRPRMIVLSVHTEAEAARSGCRSEDVGHVLKQTAVTDLADAVRPSGRHMLMPGGTHLLCDWRVEYAWWGGGDG